ncbi:hypothetical protein EDEG_02034 [Edhazardia aedis USNM 41457]|uniref:Uncharacterized protein n=1 Tax=Edhazardia aedis (strain USNM 41457) TaxID=1003232 RepID=J9DQP6_EDHAE|nr:hypothetical protein EDEG_02034 [Edhazardia aedis USNM 41457]|eukprot:EJW03637.1 hypothetical protein EDEG_02034 [Edhazardia aedis USNM 41457]
MQFSITTLSIFVCLVLFIKKIKCAEERELHNIASQLSCRRNIMMNYQNELRNLEAKKQNLESEQSRYFGDRNHERQRRFDENYHKLISIKHNQAVKKAQIDKLEKEICEKDNEINRLLCSRRRRN